MGGLIIRWLVTPSGSIPGRAIWPQPFLGENMTSRSICHCQAPERETIRTLAIHPAIIV